MLFEINKVAQVLLAKLMFHTDILLPESELCAPCLLHIDSTLYLNEC